MRPAGDQPAGIGALAEGGWRGERFQTLLGISGSGKSATIAWTIEQLQRPTLVLAPNKSLAAQLARAQEHINNLNKALHEERQSKKKAAEKGGEPAFTKAQLKELWTEHRDDPDVLFNILSYMADETARSAQAKAVDQVELVSKKKEVDDYLAQNFPDLANDGSPLRVGVDKAKQELMLADHPFGDILALGLNNDFCYQVVKQVGNYGEIYNRNLGPDTPFNVPRGLNNIYTNGGLLYSPPFR